MEFTVSNLIILFSVFMIVSNINVAVETEIQISIVLECKNLQGHSVRMFSVRGL